MINGCKNINTYLVALSLLLVLFISGCEDETPTEQVITEEINQPVRSAAESSPLSRRDVPPSGVNVQMDLPQVAMSLFSCEEIDYTEPWPALFLFDCSTFASRCKICFLKFEPNQIIELDIYGPDGSEVEKLPVHPNVQGTARWARVIEPLLFEIGEYTVHASQANTLLATATFTVYEPTAPMMVVSPRKRSPGQQIRIIFAGFQPGESVPLHLFRKGYEDKWIYLTSLPPAQMDDRGQELTYIIETQPNDPEGIYLVVTPYTNINSQSSFFDSTFDLGN